MNMIGKYNAYISELDAMIILLCYLNVSEKKIYKALYEEVQQNGEGNFIAAEGLHQRLMDRTGYKTTVMSEVMSKLKKLGLIEYREQLDVTESYSMVMVCYIYGFSFMKHPVVNAVLSTELHFDDLDENIEKRKATYTQVQQIRDFEDQGKAPIPGVTPLA